jgi:DegV family protein with EDD domain
MTTIWIDSTADLSPSLIGRYNLSVIPLYVLLDDKTYLDGVEIHLPQLFDFVSRTGRLPKTSAASIGDFLKRFEAPGPHVYIGISSQLSATLKNAILARENLGRDDIYIVDSLNLSTGIGMLAIEAAELRDAGYDAAQIASEISQRVPKVRTSFIIDTLDYLYKGGRCSALQNLMGSLLSIRPIIEVRKDGTLGVRSKTRGARRKGLMTMISDFEKDLPQVWLKRVFVTHTGCDEDAEFLKQELLNRAPIEEILITYAGSVIASHCGPNTIGILYRLK